MAESMSRAIPGVKVYAHRAGWTESSANNMGDKFEQNSIPRAKETLNKVGGVEIDIGFTKDGAAVVTHDNVSKMSFEDFKKENPSHATFESWVNWFKTDPGMQGKEIYLDLKGTEQDPYRLLEMVAPIGDRVAVGSKDTATVFKLLLARKLLGSNVKIDLQIPDPVVPALAVNYANNLLHNVGIEPENLDIADREAVSGLKPDGLHFYWPENLAKDIVSEMKKNGDFYPAIDGMSMKRKGVDVSKKIFPNIIIFHDMQRARLKLFTKLAHEKGYEVIAGSTANPLEMDRMIGWGVDAIMPNNPESFLANMKTNNNQKVDMDQPEIQGPGDNFTLTTDIKEHNLSQESPENALREQYLRLVKNVKSVSSIRQQVGI